MKHGLHRHAALIFLKYPEPGKVKTRLGESIGNDRAAEVYSSLVHGLISSFEQTRIDFIACLSPGWSYEDYVSWLGFEPAYIFQHGGDLGERMKNAFRAAFALGIEKAVLVGSDIPELNGQSVIAAMEGLERSDCVIGPATDGGYYLIAFKRRTFLSAAFENIRWSTGDVFARTKTILGMHGRSLQTLKPLRDLDTGDDLEYFIGKGVLGR